ncbi:hypothetical protein PRIPAC_70089 [Pristionchus pacificus]|nr:hypothetical protein PRIPAC_70089 [Pristionchus pacificus]
MVTVAYRLGAFGAMSLGDENVLPSNLFLHDVLEAVHFTRREIHNFGGDKDQITIMGHSTGATMVMMLSLSPGINKDADETLFARSIAMSASPILKKKEKQVERSNAVASVLGCNGTAQEIVDCLLPFSTDQIVQAAFEAGEDNAEKMLLDITMTGELVPIRSMRELSMNRMRSKLLLGTTQNELGFIDVTKETDYVNVIIGVQNEEECSQKYMEDRKSGKFDPGYNLISQAAFMLTWTIANGQAMNGGEVYLYQFDHPTYSFHGDDTFYVVQSRENLAGENEEWLNRVYPQYFSNFIKGLPLPQDWKHVDPALMNYYSIYKSSDGVEPTMKLDYHKTIADYYTDMIKFDENLTKGRDNQMLMFLFLFFVFPFVSSLSNFPIIRTSYGSVRGYEYRAKNGFIAEIFKKIPFAAPPIGAKRWKKPVPPEAWNYTIDGTFFGPACAQHPSHWAGYVTGFSEDCLTLNIYTSTKCREAGSSCPVVVYIHGGFALFDGTMMFPDETIVTNFASKGIIMVTVAYRLGVFGVLALGNENVLPANIAIHDVLESIRFIRKEIHNFGGDKDQISVMGHSTGSTVIFILAFSPGIENTKESPLFARAIAMSGTVNFNSEEKQIERSHAVTTRLGCSGTAQEIIDCMMLYNTCEIIQAAKDEEGDMKFMSPTQLADITLAGELMQFRSGKELSENKKPIKLMVGTIMNEFDPPRDFYRNASIETKQKLMCSKKNKVCEILGLRNYEECSDKYYNDCISGKFEPGMTVASQSTFMTNWLFANAHAMSGGEAYLYQFDYIAHAQHTDDAYYVMGFHEHPKDVNEEWLSRVYPAYFANFIKGVPLAPDWKPVDPELMNYYSVNKSFTDGVSPEMKLGYHRILSDYYLGLVEFDEKISKLKQTVFNAPVQYKDLSILSDEPFEFRDLIVYLTIIGIILFIAFKLYQCYDERQNRGERSPFLQA